MPSINSNLHSRSSLKRKRTITDDYSSSYASSEDEYSLSDHSYDSSSGGGDGEDMSRYGVGGHGSKKNERQLMRPWLIDQVNSGEIPGLEWLDQKKSLIKIPWTHASRHGWEAARDCELFKMWAIHTNKYSEDDKDGPKRWKANFRCAMNSLPDVQADDKATKKKGHEAFKVYRLLEEKKRGPQRKKVRNNSSESSSGTEQHFRRYATKADRLEAHHRHVNETLKKKISSKYNSSQPSAVDFTSKSHQSPSAIDIKALFGNIESEGSTSTKTPTTIKMEVKEENKNNNCISHIQIHHNNNGLQISDSGREENNNCKLLTSKSGVDNFQSKVEREEEVVSTSHDGINLDFESHDEHSYAARGIPSIPSFVELEQDDPTSDYNSSSSPLSGYSEEQDMESEKVLQEIICQYTTQSSQLLESSTTIFSTTSGSEKLAPLLQRNDSMEFGNFMFNNTQNSTPTLAALAVPSSFTNTCTTSINNSPSYLRELQFNDYM